MKRIAVTYSISSTSLALSLLFILINPESADKQNRILVDNFEQYEPGSIADEWKYITGNKEIVSAEDAIEKGELFQVRQERGNRFLRVQTKNESLRFSKINGTDFNWNIDEYPILRWRWRAQHLPTGASEKDKNDTGGAIYVTFDSDILGRPKSIKYTYSSSLPIGTKISFGSLKVIVVANPMQNPVKEWHTMQRNVREDYKSVFGGFLRRSTPPDHPKSITIWGDSDNTNDSSLVDFDDIILLSKNGR